MSGTGGQWREVPAEFGAWSTVHNRFRQWRGVGLRAQARAATSRVKAAMMTATRT
ncbi:transposase [Streptomyces sp. Rer75]|uniref:transposase n=1 Tax=unclassified Streptomyces TaxID=2593676 RepID=UPI0015CFF39F|nr:transposase [Streptomyces sp. Rer75]